MRSFADYRKSEFKRNAPALSISGGISGAFDVMKLEVLEAVKLPEMLFESSMVARSCYDVARKEDFADNKAILETCFSYCKQEFLAELIAEAEAISAADPLADLRVRLSAKVKELVAQLKTNITAVLKGARPTTVDAEDDPSAAPSASGAPAMGGPAAAKTAAPTAGAGPAPGSAASGPASAPAATGGPSISPAPMGSGPASASSGSPAPSRGPGSVRSSGGSSKFSPAAKGSFRPSDGFGAGLKRVLWDPVKNWVKDKWKNVRRRWHNDPMREHLHLLETVFLENFDDVMKTIDSFEKELLQFLNDKSVLVQPTAPTPAAGPKGVPTTNVTGRVEPNGAVDPAAAGLGPAATPGVASPVPGQAPEAEGGPDAHKGVEQPLEALPKDERQVEEVRRMMAANKGAQLLGISIQGIGPKGGWSKEVRPSSFIKSDGQPVVVTSLNDGEKQKGGWAMLRNALYKMIFDKIEAEEPATIDAYRTEKRASGVRATVGRKDKIAVIKKWLGVEPVGSRTAIIDMLSAFYKKNSGHVAAPAPAPAAEGQPAAAPSATATDPASSATTPVEPKAEPAATSPSSVLTGRPEPTAAPAAATAPATGRPVVAPAPKVAPVTGRPEVEPTKVGDAESLLKDLQKDIKTWNGLMQKWNEKQIMSSIQRSLEAGNDPAKIVAKLQKLSAGEPDKKDVGASATSAASTVSSKNKVRQGRALVEDLFKDPEYADLKQHIDMSKLSDEEIAGVIGDLDPFDEKNYETVADAIIDLYDKKFYPDDRKPDAAPAAEAPKPEAPKPVTPAAVKPETAPSAGGTYAELKNNGRYQSNLNRYSKVLQDNGKSEEDAQEAADHLDMHYRKQLLAGSSIQDIMGDLIEKIQAAIEDADSAEFDKKPELARKSDAKISGKTDKGGDSFVDQLQGMRQESFALKLAQFKKLLKS